MDDHDIIRTIGELVAEEHQLRDRSDGVHRLGDSALDRLWDLSERLDQCWDLLRQRRARQEYGEDPDGAEVRPARQVESYRQ